MWQGAFTKDGKNRTLTFVDADGKTHRIHRDVSAAGSMAMKHGIQSFEGFVPMAMCHKPEIEFRFG